MNGCVGGEELLKEEAEGCQTILMWDNGAKGLQVDGKYKTAGAGEWDYVKIAVDLISVTDINGRVLAQRRKKSLGLKSGGNRFKQRNYENPQLIPFVDFGQEIEAICAELVHYKAGRYRGKNSQGN